MLRTGIKILLASSATSLLLGVSVASALIDSPYAVDEKSQVIFGDSISQSGYEGLENYLYEYVGGYLHITYTYTHHVCCVASYSPKLYITAEDPTTTATPTQRSLLYVFQLLSGTHGTDWYAYDIQFDATGYTVVVKRTGVLEILNAHTSVSGQTDGDFAALANEYPVIGVNSMAFTPRLVHEAPPVSSGGGSTETNRSRAKADYLRCVDTNIGLYCANEIVRERYIKQKMEQLAALKQMLQLALIGELKSP